MTTTQFRMARAFQGRRVHLAIAGGSRLDDVMLVSVQRRSLWIYTDGQDVFVPSAEVVDVWESHRGACAA